MEDDLCHAAIIVEGARCSLHSRLAHRRGERRDGSFLTRGLHWFRNDLRLRDNTALDALAQRAEQWLPVFVIDPRLAGPHAARRTAFLLDTLAHLGRDLAARGVPLLVRTGRPETVLPALLRELHATLLSWNAGSTPFARRRDAAVRRAAERQGAHVIEAVDHVVFRADEVRTKSGGPYAVFTPYRNAWWQRWRADPRPPRRAHALPPPIPGAKSDAIPPPADAAAELPTGGADAAARRLRAFLAGPVASYHEDRNRPDRDGTSRLSPYLRFGAISIRKCFDDAAAAAVAEPQLRQGIAKWLDELVWREFYAAILEQHPRVLRESYRREFDRLLWNDDSDGFVAWCEGRTGFPFVDAGMRQLRATGWMHNRVRMVVASFLTKDLLLDWRAGERFFFAQLVDGDPASNNGGWQWAASTGTDPQPYFRIFNPIAQGQRFDPEGDYVRRWVPELRGIPGARVHEPWDDAPLLRDYPRPIVDHAQRRALALERYRAARAGAGA
jgi:deoxyribodipyrimidine photo-lyase